MGKRTIYCIVTSILVISMLLSGCATESNSNSNATATAKATGTTAPSSANSTGASTSSTEESKGVLSGYPIDLMPLYKLVKVNTCSFTMRNDPNYVIGKDFYTLSYQAKATIGEISKYYKARITDIDKDYNKEDYFEGRINGHKVIIMLYDEGNGITKVSVLLGLRAGDYVTENPYFSNYPKDLIEVKSNCDLNERKFERRAATYSDEVTIYYIDTYTTKISIEELKTFYLEKYKSAESYRFSEDNSSYTYTWVSQGYSCRVYINKADLNSLRNFHVEVSKKEK